MTTSPPVYQQRDKVALDPSKRLPDKYFGYSPSEHEDERGRYIMQLRDTLDAQSMPDHLRVNDAQMYLHEIETLEQRIQRHTTDRRLKIDWPDRSRFDEMVRIGQEMKAQYPLEQFIHDHVLQCDLRPAGDTWLGNCPIPTHDDTTPSFRVYDSIRFKCFGCGASGDVLDLIGLVFGIERFSDRLEFLAEVMR
jgi:hypothetical protein